MSWVPPDGAPDGLTRLFSCAPRRWGKSSRLASIRPNAKHGLFNEHPTPTDKGDRIARLTPPNHPKIKLLRLLQKQLFCATNLLTNVDGFVTTTVQQTEVYMKLIGYVRVSTQKQGESGLGLDAQLFALDQYKQLVNGEVVQTYREVESGTDCSRPQLAKAIAHAKRIKARLVIAKLDRLARNVHFISGLMETNVDFVSAESPADDKFIIQVKAAVAEEEARKISQRTKAALAAAKRRGVLLGSARPGHWEGREDARLAGARKGAALGGKAMREKFTLESAPLYDEVLPTIRQLAGEGKSLREIAAALNGEGRTTLRGLPWNAVQISRLLKTA